MAAADVSGRRMLRQLRAQPVRRVGARCSSLTCTLAHARERAKSRQMRWLTVMCAALVATGVACEPEPKSVASEQRGESKQKSDAGRPDEQPPLERWRAKIHRATPEGNLCPDESVLTSISDDEHTATITFSAAEVQPADEEKLSFGSCRIALELGQPFEDPLGPSATIT